MMATLTAQAVAQPSAPLDLEPDEEWKARLKKRIDQNMQSMVQDAKNNLENQLKTSTASRDRLVREYEDIISALQSTAIHSYQTELELERRQRRRAINAIINPDWSGGMKEEQEAIMTRIRHDSGRTDGTAQTPVHGGNRSRNAIPSSSTATASSSSNQTKHGTSQAQSSQPPPTSPPSSVPPLTSNASPIYPSPTPSPQTAVREERPGNPRRGSDTLNTGGVTRRGTYGSMLDRPERQQAPAGWESWASQIALADDNDEGLRIPERARTSLERSNTDKESRQRSISDRNVAHSPPQGIPEFWRPSISNPPEESKAFSIARRTSSTSMRSGQSINSRQPATQTIPERTGDGHANVDVVDKRHEAEQGRAQGEKSKEKERENGLLHDRQGVPVEHGQHDDRQTKTLVAARHSEDESPFFKSPARGEVEYHSQQSSVKPIAIKSVPSNEDHEHPHDHRLAYDAAATRPLERYTTPVPVLRNTRDRPPPTPESFDGRFESYGPRSRDPYNDVSLPYPRPPDFSRPGPVRDPSYTRDRRDRRGSDHDATHEYSRAYQQAVPINVPKHAHSYYQDDERLGWPPGSPPNDARYEHHYSRPAGGYAWQQPHRGPPYQRFGGRDFNDLSDIDDESDSLADRELAAKAEQLRKREQILTKKEQDLKQRREEAVKRETEALEKEREAMKKMEEAVTRTSVITNREFAVLKREEMAVQKAEVLLRRETEVEKKEKTSTALSDKDDKAIVKEKELAGREDALERLKTDVLNREVFVTRREEELEKQEDEFSSKEADLNVRAMQLQSQEEDIRRWEEKLERRRGDVEEREADARDREEAARKKLADAKKQEEDAKRKEKEARRKETEARRQENEAKQREEEAQNREEEARLAEEEATKREEEAQRRDTELRHKLDMVSKREQELKQRETELEERAGHLNELEVFLTSWNDDLTRQAGRYSERDGVAASREDELRLLKTSFQQLDAQCRALEADKQRLEVERTKALEERDRANQLRQLAEIEIQKLEMERQSRDETKNRAEAEWRLKEEERHRAQQEEYRRREEEMLRRKRQGSVSSESPRAGSSYTSTSPSAGPSPAWTSQRPASTAPPGWGTSSASAWSTSTKPTTSASASSASTSTPNKPRAGSSGTGSMPAPSPAPPPTAPTPAPLSESEWQKRQEEHSRQQQEQFRKEQERLESIRLAKASKNLGKDEAIATYDNHERQWGRLSNGDDLRWESFPWPMFKRPQSPEDITASAINAYIVHPNYPEKDKAKGIKDRIKDHIRRWHPDRFNTKFLSRVAEDDRELVQEGAGSVVRGLNELLTRTNIPGI